MKLNKELVKGIFKENPVFCLVLGLCPALAVSNRVENALIMSLAVNFVRSAFASQNWTANIHNSYKLQRSSEKKLSF